MLVVSDRQASIQIKFRPESLELTEFRNRIAFNSAFGLNSKLFDQPNTPDLPAETAAKIGEEFLNSLVENLSYPITLSRVEYTHPHQQAPKYYTGMWEVMWTRTTAERYEFLEDYIIVYVTEEHGPTGLFVNTPSTYDESQRKRIDKSAALKSAITYGTELIAWPPAAGRLAGHKLNLTPISSALRIVNPNHLTKHTDPHDASKARDLNARLAWIITFETTPPPDATLDSPATIHTWIDAENGKSLGGDFQ